MLAQRSSHKSALDELPFANATAMPSAITFATTYAMHDLAMHDLANPNLLIDIPPPLIKKLPYIALLHRYFPQPPIGKNVDANSYENNSMTNRGAAPPTLVFSTLLNLPTSTTPTAVMPLTHDALEASPFDNVYSNYNYVEKLFASATATCHTVLLIPSSMLRPFPS
jgi:hypothetical protein